MNASHAVGAAPYAFEIEEGWAKLEPGWQLRDVAAVATDDRDRVFVFNRGTHPMIVFDRAGNVVDAWGDDIFTRPHGLQIGPDGMLYCTDDGAHVVRKCTPQGKVLLEIGVPGQSAPFMSNKPFNRCTHTALSPSQDIYVSDGYGNAAVHQFTASGSHVRSWGECGTDPGQFNTPHNIVCDRNGWVYVADRENHRVQVFAGDGTYETQWKNLHRPSALCLDANEDSCYVGELGTFMAANKDFPNIGPRISIVGMDGRIKSRIDQRSGLPPNQFVAPHGIAIDSHGDVYLGEVSWTVWSTYMHPGQEPPPQLRSLQKLVRVAA